MDLFRRSLFGIRTTCLVLNNERLMTRCDKSNTSMLEATKYDGVDVWRSGIFKLDTSL
jgi:hypothetical protein